MDIIPSLLAQSVSWKVEKIAQEKVNIHTLDLDTRGKYFVWLSRGYLIFCTSYHALIVFEEQPLNLLFHGIIFPLKVETRGLHLILNLHNLQRV